MANTELGEDLTSYDISPGSPISAGGESSVEAQTARLSDIKMQTAQRQALVTEIGRVKGNRHLQMLISSSKSQYELMKNTQLLVNSYIQRSFGSSDNSTNSADRSFPKPKRKSDGSYSCRLDVCWTPIQRWYVPRFFKHGFINIIDSKGRLHNLYVDPNPNEQTIPNPEQRRQHTGHSHAVDKIGGWDTSGEDCFSFENCPREIVDKLPEATARYESLNVTYDPDDGPNSNSFVEWILDYAGFKKPPQPHPGLLAWGYYQENSRYRNSPPRAQRTPSMPNGNVQERRDVEGEPRSSTLQRQQVAAGVSITNTDRHEFELLKRKIEDMNVTEYVNHRIEFFGSNEAYAAFAAESDRELYETKGLRRKIELRNNPEAQIVFYRWVRRAYHNAGINDVPGLIRRGRSQELKDAIDRVRTAYGRPFRHGGFNPRPKKSARYRYRLGSISEHGLGNAIDINARSNPILSLQDWNFIQNIAGKTIDRGRNRWDRDPQALWNDINELNNLFVANITHEIGRIEGEQAAIQPNSQVQKLPKPIDVVFTGYRQLKKWKNGFFTLEWELVEQLHRNNFVWGATFRSSVDLHHFELSQD